MNSDSFGATNAEKISNLITVLGFSDTEATAYSEENVTFIS